MNANVSIYQDSVKDSSGILTSESNEIGSLKIIMPDKLNQLTARSSYICHIDDFVKGNKDYYGFWNQYLIEFRQIPASNLRPVFWSKSRL